LVKRRIYDDEKHIHFVTFSCYGRRKFLAPGQAKRIVIGHPGSKLSKHDGLCLGFVIMPDHVHALISFPETRQLSPFMNEWRGSLRMP
jgi:putative transposase